MVTATIVILLILAIVSAAVWFSGMFNREEAIEPMRSDMQRLGHEFRTEVAEEFHPNIPRDSIVPSPELIGVPMQEQLDHIEATEREIQSDSFQAIQQQLQTASILLGEMNQTVQRIGVLMDMEHRLQQAQQQMNNQS